MVAHDLLADITNHGVVLQIEAGTLVAIPASRLTAGQREGIRQLKPELMALLAANDSVLATGEEVLTRLAARHYHPVADLLDWYRDEIETFLVMPENLAVLIVDGYVRRQDIYRPGVALEAVTCPSVASLLITCQSCRHFVPDERNPKAGIGGCSIQGEGSIQLPIRYSQHDYVEFCSCP